MHGSTRRLRSTCAGKKALDLTTTNGDIAQTTAATLDTLMTQDADSGTGAGRKIMDNAWRGAACYHYYCLAHRQLYDAQYVDAMKTSIRLSEYEDILPKVDIYSLVAASAYHAKDWRRLQQAFIKLETLDDPPQCDDEKEDYLEEIQKRWPLIYLRTTRLGDKSPNNAGPVLLRMPGEHGRRRTRTCTKTGGAVLDGRTIRYALKQLSRQTPSRASSRRRGLARSATRPTARRSRARTRRALGRALYRTRIFAW